MSSGIFQNCVKDLDILPTSSTQKIQKSVFVLFNGRDRHRNCAPAQKLPHAGRDFSNRPGEAIKMRRIKKRCVAAESCNLLLALKILRIDHGGTRSGENASRPVSRRDSGRFHQVFNCGGGGENLVDTGGRYMAEAGYPPHVHSSVTPFLPPRPG